MPRALERQQIPQQWHAHFAAAHLTPSSVPPSPPLQCSISLIIGDQCKPEWAKQFPKGTGWRVEPMGVAGSDVEVGRAG